MTTRLHIWLVGLVTLLALPAVAAVPGTLLVEGTLANIAGAPVADGVYAVKFAVYGDAVSASPLWQEGPVSVAVKGGGFSQLLGVTKPLTNEVLAAGSSPMLALAVGSDPELPRKPMASVPFALRAAVAEKLECTGCITAKIPSSTMMQRVIAATAGEVIDFINDPLWDNIT